MPHSEASSWPVPHLQNNPTSAAGNIQCQLEYIFPADMILGLPEQRHEKCKLNLLHKRLHER